MAFPGVDAAAAEVLRLGAGARWRSADGEEVRIVDAVDRGPGGASVRWRRASAPSVGCRCPIRSFSLWIAVRSARPVEES
jgi:hypothetical protein